MVIFLIIVALLALLAIAVSVSMQARADALQAQAAIEVVAFGFALLVALILLGYMLYQRSKSQPQGKWVAGPNAHWGRVGDGSRPASLPLPQGDPLQQLVQLEMLRYLRQMNTPSLPSHTHTQAQAYLPRPAEEDDDEPLW